METGRHCAQVRTPRPSTRRMRQSNRSTAHASTMACVFHCGPPGSVNVRKPHPLKYWMRCALFPWATRCYFLRRRNS